MDKLTMAHEMALKIAESGVSVDICAGLGWRYADAMQAEADKRQGGVPEAILKASNSSQLEWQPDWSVAPKHMNYFFMDRNGSKFWTVNEPDKPNRTEHVMNFTDCGGDCYAYASDQDYKGDWRNSLRKRPEMEVERRG
ncbi:hypothetical protein [Acinetobacter sp. WCHAc060025]|uniref:hypothetical protein n=1 Tax=Acinetobacter sp. WCHAc060025 TaxID=2518625 RepID=UPI001023467A|nr:hypothetical protein [Acinetobacter sp. WCHAc060025]RZG74749.1 hypothetical protein EXE09_12210 [Acinetobacter sp. WCHAc060025]